MKGIFVFVLIIAVSATQFEVPKDQDGNPVIGFLTGFLKGVGEPKDVNDLMKCVKDIQYILKKIEEAIKLIKELEVESIIKGIEALIDAITELSTILKPCTVGYDTLKRLIEAIYDADFRVIFQKLMQDIFKYIGLINAIIGGFISKEYENAGNALGRLLRTLFISNP